MGRWLNGLTWIDHMVILFLFAICGWLAHLTKNGVRSLVKKTSDKTGLGYWYLENTGISIK